MKNKIISASEDRADKYSCARRPSEDETQGIPFIFTIIGLVILSGAGYFIWRDYSARNIVEEKPSVEVKNVGVDATGDYTVTQVPIAELEAKQAAIEAGKATTGDTVKVTVPMPAIDRPINIPANISADGAKIIRDKIAQIVAILKQKPDSVSAWISLGIYRKTIEDYEGTIQAWEYASILSPDSPVVYDNLGSLYGYYLKDFKKAEVNYKKAIENSNGQSQFYYSFATFYIEVLKDNAKAKQILQQGIAASSSTAPDLEQLLKSL